MESDRRAPDRTASASGPRQPSAMRRRLLLLDLVPGSPPVPRIHPLVVIPMHDGRATVPLDGATPEEALAELLAQGVAIRASRVIDDSGCG